MREYFTYGSVRGAAGNGGPYRDNLFHSSLKRFLTPFHRPMGTRSDG
jgi:hypothetical protein